MYIQLQMASFSIKRKTDSCSVTCLFILDCALIKWLVEPQHVYIAGQSTCTLLADCKQQEEAILDTVKYIHLLNKAFIMWSLHENITMLKKKLKFFDQHCLLFVPLDIAEVILISEVLILNVALCVFRGFITGMDDLAKYFSSDNLVKVCGIKSQSINFAINSG